MRRYARAAAVTAVLLALSPAVRAQPQASGPVRLLDVPFIQQSEALCGGAAAAMVMRYWGATDVYAETFAPLVDNAAGGIRGEALLRELTGRGWDARSLRGDRELVHARLAAGQPVIALIEDRPGAYHYVVIVAWANGRLIYHDPARAPFRVVDEDAFLRAWDVTQRWLLLALPGSAVAARSSASPSMDDAPSKLASSSACGSLVAEGVKQANDGDRGAALQTLTAAAEACLADAAPWREIAGVHAVAAAWPEAARYAAEAVRRDPDDAHAWRILATSRYLTDNFAEALDAWNAVGEPLLDIVNIHGLEHTRYAAAASAMRLRTQTVLSGPALAAAARRLADVPSAQLARVTYRPLENGRAAVDAVLIERPRSPFGLASLAVSGLRAMTDREVIVAVANPTGGGDLAALSWRWWERRPRIAAAYAAPLSFGGVLRTEVYRDEQTYGFAQVVEVRKGGGVSLSDWTTRGLRWEVGVDTDAWSDRGKTVSVRSELEQRAWSDRLTLVGTASLTSGSFSAWTSGAGIQWRSATRHEGQVVLARAGLEAASSEAPLAFWPGAGFGHARRTLLRAHALLDDGVVTGDIFGRRVVSGGTEWRRWSKPIKGAIRVAPAVFVDAARAEHRQAAGDAWHVDAGGGIRVAIPGSHVLRIDVARGLRDGKTVVSAGWIR